MGSKSETKREALDLAFAKACERWSKRDIVSLLTAKYCYCSSEAYNLATSAIFLAKYPLAYKEASIQVPKAKAEEEELREGWGNVPIVEE